MIELKREVVRRSRDIVHAAKDRKVVIELQPGDVISMRAIGTNKANAYTMTFEDFFWTCARNHAAWARDQKRKKKK
jgi:hypothetical protein